MKFYNSFDNYLNENKEIRELIKKKAKERKENSKEQKKDSKTFVKDYKDILKELKFAIKKDALDQETKEVIVASLKDAMESYKESSIYPIDLNDYESELPRRLRKFHSKALEIMEEIGDLETTETETEGSTSGESLTTDASTSGESVVSTTDEIEGNSIDFDSLHEDYKGLIEEIKKNKIAPFLNNGSKGKYVKLIQKLATQLGSDIKVDGIYGPNTKKAVEKLQNKIGVNDDGIFGSKSWSALLNDNIEAKKESGSYKKEKSKDNNKAVEPAQKEEKLSYEEIAKKLFNSIYGGKELVKESSFMPPGSMNPYGNSRTPSKKYKKVEANLDNALAIIKKYIKSPKDYEEVSKHFKKITDDDSWFRGATSIPTALSKEFNEDTIGNSKIANTLKGAGLEIDDSDQNNIKWKIKGK